MRQLFRFICWLPSKAVRKLVAAHYALMEVFDDDPAGGWFFGFFSILFGLIFGVLVYGALMVVGIFPAGGPEPGAVVGTGVGFVYFIIVLFRKLYLSFVKEQNELFNKLRGDE